MTRNKGLSFEQQFLLEKMMNDSELRFKHVMRIIEKQEEEIQKLKEALKFYANRREAESGWGCENGERARKALGLDKKSESLEYREMGK